MILRRATELVAAPWRNGLGTTREIAAADAPDGSVLWQVGIADLERDAPFSDFPGCDRLFTPIGGDQPPALAIDGAPFRPCPFLVPVRFPGDVPTLSRVPAPARAFNLVWRRGALHPSVTVHRLEPGSTLATPPGTGVIHCLEGTVALADATLHAGDSAILQMRTVASAPAPATVIVVALG